MNATPAITALACAATLLLLAGTAAAQEPPQGFHSFNGALGSTFSGSPDGRLGRGYGTNAPAPNTPGTAAAANAGASPNAPATPPQPRPPR